MGQPASLKFLIDNALSPLVANMLRDAGFDAVHLRERRLQAADDDVLFDMAAKEDRVIVSQDTDSGTALARKRVSRPSVILFRRRSGWRPQAQVGLLLSNLPQVADALWRGWVVVLEQTRVRIRALPID